MAIAAAVPATSGATSAGSRTLDTMTEPLTVLIPAPTTTAPIRPPKRACEELEGSPTSQVSRFQTMAPTRPANDQRGDQALVEEAAGDGLGHLGGQAGADEVEDSGQDHGRSRQEAPVAIGPAMAFALSWKPLVKSKMRATTTTTMTTNSSVTRGPHPLQRARYRRQPRLDSRTITRVNGRESR